jgi:galactose-1-phosphate uridylyltransferase
MAIKGGFMDFPKIVRFAQLLSPPDFVPHSSTIEYREDPLTHTRCRINIERAKRPKQAQRPVDLSQFAIKPPDCPFCPQNIEQMTPLFPKAICEQGRIKRGEAVVFPNLFPFAEYHAVGVFTKEHFLDLPQFTAEMLINNMVAVRDYLRYVYRSNNEAKFPICIWNHLLPSAATMVHPHVQILIERTPTAYQQRLLKASEEYFLATGRNFWHDLIEEEKRGGKRFIGENGAVSLIASYAPQGNREIQLIIKGASNLSDLEQTVIEDIAHAIIKLLRGYSQMGVTSFNMSTFSGPMGEKLNYYTLNAKLISRPSPQPAYRNDTGALERFHYEADIEMEPEALAQKMKDFWK